MHVAGEDKRASDRSDGRSVVGWNEEEVKERKAENAKREAKKEENQVLSSEQEWACSDKIYFGSLVA